MSLPLVSHVGTLAAAKAATAAYAASAAPRQLGQALGARPDGDPRVVVVRDALLHDTSKTAARAIREHGFEEARRNPVLLGFSFWPGVARERLAKGHERVEAYLAGATWNVSAADTFQIDCWQGRSADPLWNNLVARLAKRAHLDWDAEVTDAWWDARKRFADLMRTAIVERGFAAAWMGGEVVVVDLGALCVVRP